VPIPAIISELATTSHVEGAKRSIDIGTVAFPISTINSSCALHIAITVKAFGPNIVPIRPEVDH